MLGFGKPPDGMERRLVLKVLECWKRECKGDSFPLHSKFSYRSLGALWANCFIIGCPRGERPTIHAVGDAIRVELGASFKGCPLDNLLANSLMAQATSYLDQVLEKKVPISRSGECRARSGHRVPFRSVLLPLRDGDNICAVLGAASWLEDGECSASEADKA